MVYIVQVLAWKMSDHPAILLFASIRLGFHPADPNV